jgi:hypothetical protein
MTTPHRLTANGKIFLVWPTPVVYSNHTGTCVLYGYRATRDGLGVRGYGRVRSASSDGSPQSVGGQLARQMAQINGDNWAALIADHIPKEIER